MKREFTGILLCGGKSSRMGRDKYALVYNNKPMYEPALDTLHRFCDEVLISSNRIFPEFKNYPILHDEISGIGPMGGLYTCLKISKTEYNMVLACDMPLVSGTLMSEMANFKGKFDAIVPMVNDRLEPLYAIYNTSILTTIEKQINKLDFSLLHMFASLNVHYFNSSVNENELLNINTPAELVL